ncbi:MAG: hemolysin family protein [Lachnospiraceae bacterium]|nr:hemolysin family protein [Lachnospiraceae bacterium]
MDSSSTTQLVAIIILMLLSGFFSSAETALSAMSRVRIQALIEDGNRQAVILGQITDQYSKMLSTILIGNNLVNIAMSAITTTLVTHVFGSVYIGVGTGLLTLLVLLFGEITPKTLAKVYSEKLALAYAPIIHKLMIVLTPVIFVVDHLSALFMRLLHVDPNARPYSITETELKTYVAESHKEGVIESEEKDIIYNLFKFSDAVAKDVMVPRIDMVTVSKDASYEEVLALFRDHMYTRLPVYEEEPDNIIGIVNIKDFLWKDPQTEFHVSDILRDAHYTYEYKKTADLMLEMRQKAQHVCFVLSEYGSCVGMLTMEDLLEEIVGDLRDEYDEDENERMIQLSEKEYMAAGSMKISDVNHMLGTEMSSEDYDSVAGLIIGQLDRLPEEGEEVTLEGGIILKVCEVSENRVLQVLIQLPQPEAEEISAEDLPNKTS